MPADSTAARGILAQRLQRQASWCDDLGSRMYGALLRSAADDLNSEGAVWGVLRGFENEDDHAALALRFMGAMHRLVLMGSVPDLASRYPSTGGDGDARGAWPAFRDALVARRSETRELMPRGCQTNEVGRSAALLGGFLEIARRTGRRLRILELGACAGFNLRWDHYRYVSEVDGGFKVAPAAFLERELASSRTGVATVVFHSVFIQYVDTEGRRRIASALEEAGSRASREGPLAYLRMEPGPQSFEVRLSMWPGGSDELLALTRAHGTGVRWL